MYKKLFITTIFIFDPSLVFAQVNDIFGAQILVYNVLERLSWLFWAMAVAFFIWGIVKFIKNADDTTEHEKGKQFMVWGIIAFLVLVSMWGIVRFLLVDTLGITPTGAPSYLDKNGMILGT